MPYGQPDIRANNLHSARIAHTSSGATAYVVIENDGTQESDMDEALQAAVDLFDATSGWSILSASKGYDGYATCTPTGS